MYLKPSCSLLCTNKSSLTSLLGLTLFCLDYVGGRPLYSQGRSFQAFYGRNSTEVEEVDSKRYFPSKWTGIAPSRTAGDIPTLSRTHYPTLLLIHSLTRSLTDSLPYFITDSLPPSCNRSNSITYPLTIVLILSLTHARTHRLTHILIISLTHPPTTHKYTISLTHYSRMH